MHAMLWSFADIQKTVQEPVHDKMLTAAVFSGTEKGIVMCYGLKIAEDLTVAWI